MSLYGFRLASIDVDAVERLFLTFVLVAVTLLVRGLLVGLGHRLFSHRPAPRSWFGAEQGLNLIAGMVVVLAVAAIWFVDASHQATAVGLVTAGLALALQKVITAVAGYGVILRGDSFSVGDRIAIGDVHGDVIAIGFTQTRVMEMGQAGSGTSAGSATWVKSRQYTGRVITFSNAKIFDDPVYNYTRDFPFLWEELVIPIRYVSDRAKAEQILLDCARRHTADLSGPGQQALALMQERYFVRPSEVAPRVYCRITDNWLELTVRFLVRDRGTREIKDAISRDVLDELDAAGIGIASTTIDIVGMPPLSTSGDPTMDAITRDAPPG